MNFADPDAPYTCTPSNVEPGKNVCIGIIFSGGGGFCALADPGTGSISRPGGGLGSAMLLGVALLGFVAFRRRRRPQS